MLKNIYIKIIALITYLGMIIVNALANILPINGISTGEISDKYANLFAPAGLTFSIWGLIYLLLGIYVVYQFFNIKEIINKINIYFIVSSIANILWIFSWHYELMFISVLIMIVILYSLIKIVDLLKKEKNLLITLPFSIYFGWITVATIANVTTFLVSVNWNGFNLSDQFWTVFILIIGTIIGLLVMLKNKDIAYGLVFIWAYFGIYYKHITFFNNQYILVIYTVLICIIIFIIGITYLIYIKNKNLFFNIFKIS
jgi:hypothetical protein